MTLNLTEREMAVVEQLAADADLSKTAVLRQALRLYQLVHERLKAGETMSFSGDKERIALFIGLGLGEPASGIAVRMDGDPSGAPREAQEPGGEAETPESTPL